MNKAPDYTYNVVSGQLRGSDGLLLAVGYSGFAHARNNPEHEAARGIGPIPRGDYMIGPPRYSKTVGPVAMYLWPVGHNAHGRSALMIHGDNKTGTASKGCVILNRATRERIAEVVANNDDATVLRVA